MRQVDLAIGDWVKLDFYDSIATLPEDAEWKNGRVVGIHSNNWLDIDFNGKIESDCDVEDVQPIPLTQELLEEITSGCESVNNHMGFSIDFEDRHLWIGKWWNHSTNTHKREGNDIAEGWWEVVVNEKLPGEYEGGVKVRYVHELQHALRILGVKMDITLKEKEVDND